MVQETRVVRAIGRCQAIEEIGHGAMGVVFKGLDPAIGRPVALKTIAISGDDDSAREFRNRLYREATAAGTLSHTNIVTIYDVVEEGDTTAIAMEFVEGESLEAIITRLAPLPPATALDLLSQISAARPDVGALRVTSTPTDADVFLDKQLVGRTPFERDVCAGTHQVRVRHRIGSSLAAATVVRGRLEVPDVALKPDIAFLGALESTGGKLVSSPPLTAGIERVLASVLAFNLALTHMRFGEWREAIDLLASVTSLPNGPGVGKGAAAFFRARCHEELGERDRALALYKEAAAADAELFDEDGTTVGQAARRRLAVFAASATAGAAAGR
jgi:hypothetical protein